MRGGEDIEVESVRKAVRSILLWLAGLPECNLVNGLYLVPANVYIHPRPLTLAALYTSRRRWSHRRLMIAAGDDNVIQRLIEKWNPTEVVRVDLEECPPGYEEWKCGTCRKVIDVMRSITEIRDRILYGEGSQ